MNCHLREAETSTAAHGLRASRKSIESYHIRANANMWDLFATKGSLSELSNSPICHAIISTIQKDRKGWDLMGSDKSDIVEIRRIKNSEDSDSEVSEVSELCTKRVWSRVNSSPWVMTRSRNCCTSLSWQGSGKSGVDVVQMCPLDPFGTCHTYTLYSSHHLASNLY